jgi:L,D-peptidoglycan transpeptidase YkuD (ErfK/YbiS/YcfS/YnhG family)
VRARVGIVALAALLVALLGLPGTATRHAAAATTSALQVIVVSAPTSTSTVATVDAFQRQPDGRYKRLARFPSARVGAAGIGRAREGVSRTPAGLFRLSVPFGLRPDPGVRGARYLRVDRDDVWTGSDGTVLNVHRRCAPGTCPSGYGAFERLSNHPGAYDLGFLIGHNAPAPWGTGAVRGAGSAFFFHVKDASATGGCVAVSRAEMDRLLRWLRFGTAPVVSIGVGAAPYAVMPHRYA